MSRRPARIPRWSIRIGADPAAVRIFERPEHRGAVYVTWVDPDLPAPDRRRTRALGFAVRDATGELDPVLLDEAEARAYAWYLQLFPSSAAPAPPPNGWLSLANGLARALATESGAFARSPRHAQTARHHAGRLVALFGADTPWARLDAAALAAGWRSLARRHRATGRGGPAAAVSALAVLVAGAAWLRAEGLIPPGAAMPPAAWRHRLAADWKAILDGLA